MHIYAINDLLHVGERNSVLYRIASIAGLAGIGIAFLLNWVTSLWQPGAAISAPSTVLIYFWILTWLEKSGWKQPVVRFMFGITTPDLNGNWEGTVSGTHMEENETRRIKFKIRQTWSTIGISLEGEVLISYSTSASVTQQGGYILLVHEYVAQPRDPARITLEAHIGTGRIRFPIDDDGVELSNIELPYYTDHRQTGMLKLTLVEPKKTSPNRLTRLFKGQ
jgi:hypothetical protein